MARTLRIGCRVLASLATVGALSGALGCGRAREACGPPGLPARLRGDAGVPVLVLGADAGAIDPCADVPALCNLPTTVVGEVAGTPQLTLLVAGDGYLVGDLAEFRHTVDRLWREVSDDVLVTHHGLGLRLVRVDVASSSRDVTNAETADTALGSCLTNAPDAGLPEWELVLNNGPWDVDALLTNVPEADAVVVVVNVNADGLRASGTLGVVSSLVRPRPPLTIRLARDDTGKTLTHELGHAWFNLGDEYSEAPGAPPQPAFAGIDPYADLPNVSTEPGAKWAGLISGAEEGGARYAHGVYHPTRHCRMLSSSEPEFCAVCADRIDEVLAVRAGRREPRPATCGALMDQRPEALGVGQVTVSLRGFSSVGLQGWVLADCACPPALPDWVLQHQPPPPGVDPQVAACLQQCLFSSTAPSFPAAVTFEVSELRRDGRFEYLCRDGRGALTQGGVAYHVE